MPHSPTKVEAPVYTADDLSNHLIHMIATRDTAGISPEFVRATSDHVLGVLAHEIEKLQTASDTETKKIHEDIGKAVTEQMASNPDKFWEMHNSLVGENNENSNSK